MFSNLSSAQQLYEIITFFAVIAASTLAGGLVGAGIARCGNNRLWWPEIFYYGLSVGSGIGVIIASVTFWIRVIF